MKTLFIVCVLALAGCGSSAEESHGAKKEQVRKNVMGSGNQPMPMPVQKKNVMGTGADIKMPDHKIY